ncbi:hypothetical protein LINPERHAP2_LOCUS6379, partial [Linum perenne]
FILDGADVRYSGGEVVRVEDVEPDTINVFYLDVALKNEVRYSGIRKYYYKKLLEGEVVSYREIVNDHHIQDLLKTYGDRDVYDIYVERVVESTNTYDDKSNNYSSESESEESKSEDSDFEVGAWISDEDREEAEVLRRKVREVKEKVKNGIPFPNHYNGDGYESQGFGSDENGYYVETDSDDETADHGVRMKNPYLMYNRNTDTPYFETTMTFTSLNEARTAVIKHSIKERRDVKYVKNESYRIRLKCKFENCSWLFFVSLNKRFNLWQLKQYKEHVCPEHYMNKHVSPKFIAQHYKERIKSAPRWKNKHMRDTISEDFGIVVSLMQCSRAKKLVLKKTFGAYEAEYAILRTYAEEILRISPGSSVKIMVDTNNPNNVHHFQRMYICFDSLKKGFLVGCRKIISLDGCFLKGLCKGELLTAVGRDANDQMYIIAWCVVEVESKSSWDWFLEQLQTDLNMGNGAGWCFSSDQQKIASKWKSNFCPKILSKLATNAKEARYCRIIGNGKEGYEVTYNHQDRFRVQLDKGKCSCRSWDLTGVPCSHSIACIISEGKDPQRYILDCYKVETYWSIYDHVMELMDGHASWTPSTYDSVQPPLTRKMPGRPKKNRVRSVEEKEDRARKRKCKYRNEELLARDKKDTSKMSRIGRVITCTFCTKEGHNTRTCALRKASGRTGASGSVDNEVGLRCTQESDTLSNMPEGNY